MDTTRYHETVMLREAVDGLAIKPNGVYVDATFGGGGHSRLIISQLGPEGKLIVFDQDEDAWQNRIDDPRIVEVHENFRHLKRFLRLHNIDKVDGVLADLGVSSFQFDTAERGFSIRFEGPLDMRMDHRVETTAATIIKEYNATQLQDVFSKYGEVRNAKQLAQHIVQHRSKNMLTTTLSFKEMIAPVVKGQDHRYYAQVFQALRIEVNKEFEVLEDFMGQLKDVIKPSGRASIITFHSLEDRIVKQYFKQGDEEVDIMKGTNKKAYWKLVTPKPIEPSLEEQKNNSRSRSAKLRVAERIG